MFDHFLVPPCGNEPSERAFDASFVFVRQRGARVIGWVGDVLPACGGLPRQVLR